MSRLKVDEIAIPIEKGYVLMCNVTIPADRLGLENLEQRIYRFLEGEYDRSGPVKFEISGTYTLKNNETQQLRMWTGSFSPKRDYALTPLLDFNQHTFTEYLRNFLNMDYLSARLTEIVPDSSWIFHSITTLIVNAQAILSLQSATLERRGILNVARGKTSRHITFDLP